MGSLFAIHRPQKQMLQLLQILQLQHVLRQSLPEMKPINISFSFPIISGIKGLLQAYSNVGYEPHEINVSNCQSDKLIFYPKFMTQKSKSNNWSKIDTFRFFEETWNACRIIFLEPLGMFNFKIGGCQKVDYLRSYDLPPLDFILVYSIGTQ